MATVSPVELKVVMTPSQASSGEMVEANLIIKNNTKKPIAITRAVWSGGLCGTAWIEVTYKGKKVAVIGGDSSSPLVQVMVNDQVTTHDFLELYPGSSTNIYWIKFDKSISQARPPSLKSDYAEWVKGAKPLDIGEYQVKGFYRFEKPKNERIDKEKSYEFTPTAKKLYDRAFVGQVSASGSFVVK